MSKEPEDIIKVMGEFQCNVFTAHYEVIEDIIQSWLVDVQEKYKKIEIVSITQSQSKEDVTVTVFWK